MDVIAGLFLDGEPVGSLSWNWEDQSVFTIQEIVLKGNRKSKKIRAFLNTFLYHNDDYDSGLFLTIREHVPMEMWCWYEGVLQALEGVQKEISEFRFVVSEGV